VLAFVGSHSFELAIFRVAYIGIIL
jgi:hypothetical protein